MGGNALMWDSFLSVEFDRYGFSISSDPFYLSISWGMIAVIGVAIVALRIRKNLKNRL
jgi:hypothetical protein